MTKTVYNLEHFLTKKSIAMSERNYYQTTTHALSVTDAEGYLSMFHSPVEYKFSQYPLNRKKGIQPSAELQHPSRGTVFRGLAKDGIPFAGIIPDRESMHRFIEGSQMIAKYYGLVPFNPIFIEDPLQSKNGQAPVDNLDLILHDSAQEVANQLRRTASSVNRYHVIHLANTPEAQKAQEELKRYGINTTNMIGPKRYDYPNPYDRSGFSDMCIKHDLPGPYARVIYNKSLIENAYIDVTTHTNNPLVFEKLSAGGGGYGVKDIHSLEEAIATWNLWEQYGMFGPYYGNTAPVEFQGAIPSIVEYLSFQYARGYITTPKRFGTGNEAGAFTRQYQTGNNWEGNGFEVSLQIPPDQQEAVDKVIYQYQLRFMTALEQEVGTQEFRSAVGGVDFALVDIYEIIHTQGIDTAKELMKGLWDVVMYYNSRYGPVPFEHNGGRVSTATIPTLLAEQLGFVEQNIPFAATKVPGVSSNLSEVWTYLHGEELQFNPTKKKPGVIPYSWIYDPEYGIQKGDIIIVAETQEDLLRIKNHTFNKLDQEGFIKNP